MFLFVQFIIFLSLSFRQRYIYRAHSSFWNYMDIQRLYQPSAIHFNRWVHFFPNLHIWSSSEKFGGNCHDPLLYERPWMTFSTIGYYLPPLSNAELKICRRIKCRIVNKKYINSYSMCCNNYWAKIISLIRVLHSEERFKGTIWTIFSILSPVILCFVFWTFCRTWIT